MRLPIALGRGRRRLQHPRKSRPSLPLVRAWTSWIRARDDTDLRSATRRRSIREMELADTHVSGHRTFSSHWIPGGARIRVGRRVLETLGLARASLVRDTGKTCSISAYYGPATIRHLIYRHRNLARDRHRQRQRWRIPQARAGAGALNHFSHHNCLFKHEEPSAWPT